MNFVSRLVGSLFLVLWSGFLSPVQAFDFDLHLNAGGAPQSDFGGGYLDGAAITPVNFSFGLATKLNLDSGIMIGRESLATVTELENVIPQSTNITPDTNNSNKTYFTYGAVGFTLGFALGENPRFAVETSFPEKFPARLIEQGEVTDFMGKSQLKGASIDFGGEGSGFSVVYRQFTFVEDTLDVNIKSHLWMLGWRYRWGASAINTN